MSIAEVGNGIAGTGAAGLVTPPPELPEKDVMMRAAALVDKYETERRENQELLAKAAGEVKQARREIEFLTLELATARNDLSTMRDQCETLRQEASDMRALFSSLRAQLDHFEIPLPVRKKVKNGTPNK